MRRIAIVATALLMCVGAYCAIVVVQAWRATPSILAAALDAESVELEIGDFSAGWLEDLLAVEDPNFYQHSGVDLTTPGAGITTITQGLVKQLYFSEFRPGFAKLRQTLPQNLQTGAAASTGARLIGLGVAQA